MFKKLKSFMTDEGGAAGLEYTFIAAGIGFVLIAGAFAYGDDFNSMMEVFSAYLESETGGGIQTG